MPELPEVETIRQAITPYIENTSIKHIQINRDKCRYAFDKKAFKHLHGFGVSHTERRGKLLMILLQKKSQKAAIFIHLGMSGQIRLIEPSRPMEIQKHDHFIIAFQNGHRLCYNDARRFGWVDVAFDDDINAYGFLKKLGIEPLSDAFNTDYFMQAALARKCDIKSFLLNQKIIAGLGNIYVCEALWRCHIHPLSCVSHISENTAAKLCGHIKDILNEAIACGGSSIKDHRMIDGSLGYFQQKLAVYGKAGSLCPQCAKTGKLKPCIQKISQAGRSSFFCKNTQML